jgi:hypothetical protein
MLMRILFLVSLVTFVSLAIFRSLTAIASNGASPNYFQELANNESSLKARAKSGSTSDDQLSEVLWQEGKFTEAEKLVRRQWVETTSNPVAYSDKFVETALRLARIDLDNADYSNAAYCYKALLTYEKGRLSESDWRIARDLNNLGMTSYMDSQAQADFKKRADLLKEALSYYEGAASVYAKSGAEHTPACASLGKVLLANHELALRELERATQRSAGLGYAL